MGIYCSSGHTEHYLQGLHPKQSSNILVLGICRKMFNLYRKYFICTLAVTTMARLGSAESGNPYSDYDFSDYYLHARDDGYSAPSGSYGAPSDSYGASGDSYGAPSYGYSSDEPDYGLLLTAGVATIGALATAFYIKDIQQKIDDQEDNITALKTRYNKLVTDYEDELVADETSICKTASDFVSVAGTPGDSAMNDMVINNLVNVGDPSCST